MYRLTNKNFTVTFRPIATLLTPVVLAMQVSIIIQSCSPIVHTMQLWDCSTVILQSHSPAV